MHYSTYICIILHCSAWTENGRTSSDAIAIAVPCDHGKSSLGHARRQQKADIKLLMKENLIACPTGPKITSICGSDITADMSARYCWKWFFSSSSTLSRRGPSWLAGFHPLHPSIVRVLRQTVEPLEHSPLTKKTRRAVFKQIEVGIPTGLDAPPTSWCPSLQTDQTL